MIISPDSYRYIEKDGKLVYSFTKHREPYVWGMAYMSFITQLAWAKEAVILIGIPGSGKTTWAQKQNDCRVYFDATNTTVKDRRPLLAFCAAHGAEVSAVCFNTSLELCTMRNASRPEDRRVPDAVTTAMLRRLEFPGDDEGYLAISTQGASREL